MSATTTIIICEDREPASAAQSIRKDLLTRLASLADVELKVLPHLYDLDPGGPGMDYLRSVDGDMIVLASLYPRAAYWVLDANQVKGRMGCTSFFSEEGAEVTASPPGEAAGAPDRTIWCLDVRRHDDVAPLSAEVQRIVAESSGEPAAAIASGEQAASRGETRIEEVTKFRWYPVIDYSRCDNCLECLNFCLFGVFGIDESGTIFAEEPDACRPGCPACARVCPSRAIMFPEHDNPAVAGDPAAVAGDLNVNLAQFFGVSSPLELLTPECKCERDRMQKTESGKRAEKDDLDKLVDELDEMDL